MNNIQYPINLKFHISTFSNDFTAIDAAGKTLAYVRERMFRLIEEIQVYNNDSKSELLYKINADRWLDFNASYVFSENNVNIGRIARKGWASLWNANYQILDESQNIEFIIKEENPWVKVLDSMFGEIPILGFLTGYFFNPKYIVRRIDGNSVARLTKIPSFFGRKFTVDKLEEFDSQEETRIILGLMMLVLLERRRG